VSADLVVGEGFAVDASVIEADASRHKRVTGARDEFLLTATVQNLKRLVRHAAIPPPMLESA